LPQHWHLDLRRSVAMLDPVDHMAVVVVARMIPLRKADLDLRAPYG
jgi:hypothetical protein